MAENVCFEPLLTTGGEMISFCVDSASISDLTVVAAPDSSGDIDSMWVLLCGILVFLMQAGFMMVEAGSVSDINVQNIIFKNLMDAVIGALSFWLVGYAFAYGTDAGGFIGTSNFALSDFENGSSDWVFWFFQFVFAATAATIVSGAVAERCQMTGYFVYSLVLTAWIYPVVVHWIWADGWLSAFVSDPLWNGNGLIDFAGSGVVHLVGGVAAVVAAWKLGPRRGRFDREGKPQDMHSNSTALVAQGVFILWFGWYGFNPGSTLAASGGAADLAAKVAVVTTISAASAALTVLSFNFYLTKQFQVMRALNGVLAGLVSITASCSVVDPGHAFLIGIIGAFVYEGSSRLLLKYQIDDPVDASPIHGCCGAWGVLAAGIFATEANMVHAGYAGVTGGTLFITQLVGVLAILLWSGAHSLVLFIALDKYGWLRVHSVTEIVGLDKAEHGEVTAASLEVIELDRLLLKKMMNNTFASTGMKKVDSRTSLSNAAEVYLGEFGEHERQRLQLIFGDIDKDRDGLINRSDYRKALNHMGLHHLGITDEHLSELFRGKEKMDYSAFEALVSKDTSPPNSPRFIHIAPSNKRASHIYSPRASSSAPSLVAVLGEGNGRPKTPDLPPLEHPEQESDIAVPTIKTSETTVVTSL